MKKFFSVKIFLMLSAVLVTLFLTGSTFVLAQAVNDSVTFLVSAPRVLVVDPNQSVPVNAAKAQFNFSQLKSKTILVLDLDSRRVLLEKNADLPRADAAVAKLVTAATALNSGLPLDTKINLLSQDEVGGTRLSVLAGASLTVQDLLYAMLTDAANNATMAMARTSASNAAAFTANMNALVRSWGLTATSFADPTGIQPGTLTTSREAAAVLIESMQSAPIRRALTSMRRVVGGAPISNPNQLLTDPDNGLYVYGGKIGYLRTSGWHLLVDLQDDKKKQKRLVIILSGASSKEEMFTDAETLAKWVWKNFVWQETITSTSADVSSSTSSTTPVPTVADIASPTTASSASLPESNTPPVAPVIDVTPTTVVAPLVQTALMERNVDLAPVATSAAAFKMSNVTAKAVFVVDVPTRRVLLTKNADKVWPLASITKLMTALVALDYGTDFNSRETITAADEIGGARLRVSIGTSLSFEDLMYSMLVGSANNAAHAVARCSTSNFVDFVGAMNARAKTMGLLNTEFFDSSGLDVRNISTAREIAALAFDAFDRYEIRKMCSTAARTFQTSTGTHSLKNTNDLLTDVNNGLTVLGGKTGYLIESDWNLVVKMSDSQQHPIVLVILGSGSEKQLFLDAKTVARWVWSHYKWK